MAKVVLALKHFFDQRTVKEPKSETLLRLAELVLTLNCFSFGDNFFKQTNGVAMGTKMGPSYANLFVSFVEHQFFSQYNGPKPQLYGRYIDDCIYQRVFCNATTRAFIWLPLYHLRAKIPPAPRRILNQKFD